MTAADLPEITSTTCPQCGAQVNGVSDHYVCTLCGWVSSEAGTEEESSASG